MSIIALYHIKGGVGKTAAAVNLAHLASQEGYPTVFCDLDPQGSGSYYFRVRPSKKHKVKRWLTGDKKITNNLLGTDYEGLDVLPSHFSYRNLDIALDGMRGSKKRLKEFLIPLEKEYSLIFVDSPPNITLVSENIFNSANVLLIPVIPTTLSVLAYEKICRFFTSKNLGDSKIAAFFSMVEKRKVLHREIIDRMHAVDKKFFRSEIPYSAVVEKMGIHREPVACFAPASKAAIAFRSLWVELKKHVKNLDVSG